MSQENLDHRRSDSAGEERLRTALCAADLVVWDWDLQTDALTWEGRYETLLGFEPGVFDGTYAGFERRVHPEDVSALRLAVQRAREGRTLLFHDFRIVWPEGGVHRISIRGRSVCEESGQAVRIVGVLMDITALQQEEETMRRLQETAAQQAQILEAAHRIALDILASQTGKEALERLAETARRLVDARYAAIGIADPQREGLQEFITVGLTPEEESRIGARPQGRGVLGLLLKCTEPLRLNNLADCPASSGFPPHHPHMTSFLGVPIRLGQTVLGNLYLTDKAGGQPFTEADTAAVQALGSHVAVAIRNLQMMQRQRALVSRLMTAQEEERRSIAYDLHDGLTQYVMGAHAFLQVYQKALAEGKSEKASRDLAQGMRYLKEAVVESRRLVNGLRLLALEDMGLEGALEQLVREEKGRAGWKEADFYHNIAGQHFDIMLETTVYRIAQEALTNARKYAAAQKVRITLLHEQEDHTGNSRLRLEVRDWGEGFDPEAIRMDSSRVGLHGISERVRLLNGQMEILSESGKGTTLNTTFPCQSLPEEQKGEAT